MCGRNNNSKKKKIALGIGDKHKNRDANRRQIKFIVQREALARMFSKQMKFYDRLV